MDADEAPVVKRRRQPERRKQPESKDYLSNLAEELFVKIVRYLLWRTRLLLRVNKTLERRLSTFPINIDCLSLELQHIAPETEAEKRNNTYFDGYEVRLQSSRAYKKPYATSDFSGLRQSFLRLAQNTTARRIFVKAQGAITVFKEARDAIETLFQFNAEYLHIQLNSYFKFPNLTFATLLPMAQNIRVVQIDVTCTGIDGMDLFIFRNTLLDDDDQNDKCKLELFSVMVTREVVDDFIRKCFKVVRKRGSEPIIATKSLHDYGSTQVVDGMRETLRFEGDKGTMQFHSSDPDYPEDLHLFKNNLITKVDGKCITLKKFDRRTRIDLVAALHPVKLNHTYSKPYHSRRLV